VGGGVEEGGGSASKAFLFTSLLFFFPPQIICEIYSCLLQRAHFRVRVGGNGGWDAH